MLTFFPYSIKIPFTKTSALHYSSPTIPTQPASPTMMTPAPGPSDKSVQVTSTLFLNAAQAATVKADMLVILAIGDDLEEYHWEL
jgi:hypothetical protein